jgi:bifunctional enzyme CysN/CysC
MTPAPSPRDLLRVVACGSVDDGKSTLIGRLVHEAGGIPDDQAAALARVSRRHGTTGGATDFALLLDGLEAEREQGITIDVAHRFFATPARSFVLADAPGHAEYTRNMATAASTADLALLLVDARRGLLPQTRRHARICALMGLRHVALAVNKMDLVDFAEAAFEGIVADFRDHAGPLGFADVTAIPLSALTGDNVAAPSARMAWHRGPTLLAHLETVAVGGGGGEGPFRFPVQRVNRPTADFRGLDGTVVSGAVAVGDPVTALPSGRESRIARIVTFDGDLDRAEAGRAVTLVLADDLDVARGDLLCRPDARAAVADQMMARLVWLHPDPLLPGRDHLMRIGTAEVPARVTALRHRIDVDTHATLSARTLAMNEIGQATLATARPVAFDPYAENRATGAFVLIDRATDATVGAGMIDHPLRRATNVHSHPPTVGPARRAAAKGQRPAVLWFTGLPASGKSTIANRVEADLHARGVHTMLLDGDDLRHGLNQDLGFTEADRVENVRRAGEVARLMADAGLVVLCCLISPFAAERRSVRERMGPVPFVEIFVDTPLETCIARDPKGLYAKALAGAIPNFTGVGAPYERPIDPEVRIDGETEETAAERIVARCMRLIEP